MQVNNQFNAKTHSVCFQEDYPYRSNSQDQSTQAMTEVALALSMAFFSLLLLALISMGVPATHDNTSSIGENKHIPEFILSKSETTNAAADNEQTQQSETQTQYIFYFNEAYYDQNMALTLPKRLDPSKKLIVAMPLDTNVATALLLQQEFASFEVSLTLMNAEWLAAFEANSKH